MWISRKINNDPEVKKTLQEITKLIKSYLDATYIKKEKKFFVIDIGRFFKPRLSTYLGVVFSFAIIEALLFYLYVLELSVLNNWIRLSLDISLPILVLGISLSTVAKSLSESSRFASEYLKDSCRITFFACITFLTVLGGYLSGILFPAIKGPIVFKIMYILLSPISVGGAIWCLTSLIYIILETTKCMYPEFSIEAASNYASRKLSYAVLKETYLSVWMGKYSDILNEYLKDCRNIYEPSKYFSKDLLEKKKRENEKSGEYKINLPKEINFHFGYKDYNLSKLEEINKLLEYKKEKLYLAHNFNSKEFGALCYKEPCNEIYDKIKKEISSIYRFGKDKHVEEKESFWEEHYLKLHNALLRAINNADMAQFRKYLKSIEEIHIIIRKVRKNSIVRRQFNLDYKKYRYLLLYSKSVKWLLESKNKIEDEILELFLDALVESIWQQVKDDIRNSDWYTLDVLKWLVPDTYKLFKEHVKDKKSRLWELRARIGSFYDFTESLLSEFESDIKEEDKLQIQLVLHKGIIRWLLIAIENKDNELVKSLCEAAKRLVLPDKKITFTPQQLVTQHFILCGKMLEFLMGKKPHVSSETFKLLCFEKYDHKTGRNINYDELAKFFIDSRREYDLRSLLREFSETDWERNPLSGGGFGTPHYPFSGAIEFDYMFIYLALLCLHFSPDAEPMPFEFSGYNLKDKIEKFKDIARSIDIHSFKDSKEKLIQWLDKCDRLYKQKEEERIATAPLNKEKVSQYKDGFWKAYKNTKTFLHFCITQGHYSINNEVSAKSGYRRSKRIYVDEHTSPSSIANADGADVSRYWDKDLLKKIINMNAETETADAIISMIDKACRWLAREGANRENGILLFYGNTHIESELYNNDHYVPSWKLEKNLVFSGYYKNYPILEIYDRDVNQKCVSLNLTGWKGIEIRPEVLEKDILGEINIREWTEDEINEAISQDKIREQDRNSVKGQCPIDYELFWCLDEKVLPRQMMFSLKTEAGTNDANS